MINISIVSRRGTSHTDWNEDNFYCKQCQGFIIGGVFDGCSSGKDSYFASKLFSNIFKKTIENYKDGEIQIQKFQSIVSVFFKNLSKAINTIGLSTDETLSTAILFIYEIEERKLFVKFFGDGVAYANDHDLTTCNNDEENKPDYIGYSLKEIITTNSFNKYWEEKKSFESITKDFSISTDGIFSFKKMNESEPNFECETYLVQDNFLYKNPASLKRKLNIIKNKGYEHYDDVTIIRVLID